MATITTKTATEIDPTSDRWTPCMLVTGTAPTGTHGGGVNVLAALAALMWIVLGGGGAATSGTSAARSRRLGPFVRGPR